jgi:hypothetical protein
VDEPLDDSADIAQSTKAVVPYKVHVRGLDTFKPDEVKAYVSEHYGGQFDRIEWIDDTSANLVFKSESAAHEALISLAAVEIADASQLPPLEELPAKTFAPKPDSILQIRFAVEGDRKAAGAAARSRFYLLNPEYDPEERRRRGEFNRSKYRERDDGYRRDRRDGRRRDRYEDEDAEPFDVNLYDDDEDSLAKRAQKPSRPRRRSGSSASSGDDRAKPYAQRNHDKELFPDRRTAHGSASRNRSASPIRDHDGDARMDAVNEVRDRGSGRSLQDRISTGNKPRELFPPKEKGAKELFPSKVSSQSVGKAQMDQVSDEVILPSGMSKLFCQG